MQQRAELPQKFPKDKVDKYINFVPTPAEAKWSEGYEDNPNFGKAETFFKILNQLIQI